MHTMLISEEEEEERAENRVPRRKHRVQDLRH